MNVLNQEKNQKLAPMWTNSQNYDGPRFQKIAPASKLTGISTTYLRNGAKSGAIKSLVSGRSIYLDMGDLLTKIDNGTLAL